MRRSLFGRSLSNGICEEDKSRVDSLRICRRSINWQREEPRLDYVRFSAQISGSKSGLNLTHRSYVSFSLRLLCVRTPRQLRHKRARAPSLFSFLLHSRIGSPLRLHDQRVLCALFYSVTA
uniref:Uncharacterized protein n=1 Tax=Trichogramma kaykai TaxID=54128 RepID=A0ABD2WVZ2_9HYME